MSNQEPLQLARLVRRFRLTAGLSQEALAGRSRLSVRLISDLERGARTQPRLETIRMLAAGLALTGNQRADLIAAARPELGDATGQDDRLETGSRYRPHTADHTLPLPANSFIGREEAVAHLVAELANGQHRLITLTGPGGVGKTRLALAAASKISGGDRDVRFVPLASILDHHLVAAVIGQAVGLAGTDAYTLPDRLSVAIQDRRVLLVLDNFEQILPAAPLIARLLISCPALQVLVTSRTPLHLSMERELRVPRLELPVIGSAQDRISKTPSVLLFVERAWLHERELTPNELSSIAGICRRLDGLPLAIELAAAKIRIMPPAEILDRLDRTLLLLVDGPRDAPARLQTMRNAIAWSYNLLTSEERALFRALGVFQGGFTLAAAESIGTSLHLDSALQSLTRLLDHSLVQRLDAAIESPRFTMLETVREFALESLVANGEEELIRDHHLNLFIHQLGSPEPASMLNSPEMRQLELPGDQDNLRSALNWALQRHLPLHATQVACGLRGYWRRHGLNVEAVTVLDRLLRASESLDSIVVVGLNVRLGGFAYLCGDFPKARECAATAIEVSRHIGFAPGIQFGLHGLGNVTRWSDSASSIQHFTEALAISRSMADNFQIANNLLQLGLTRAMAGELEKGRADLEAVFPMLSGVTDNHYTRAMALATAGWIAGLQQEFDKAERLGRESVAISDAFNQLVCRYFALRVLSQVSLSRGDYRTAAGNLKDALELAHQISLSHIESFAIADVAALAQAQGDWQRAARLYGSARSTWDRLGFSDLARSMLGSWSNKHVPSQEALAGTAFRFEYESGRNLSYGGTYAEAMAVLSATLSHERHRSILSAREFEVLQLIAAGHTNREIAEYLFVSKRTIDSHVVSILSKLGVDSRRSAVAAARERGLLGAPEAGISPEHLTVS